jgi:hypothetical protein
MIVRFDTHMTLRLKSVLFDYEHEGDAVTSCLVTLNFVHKYRNERGSKSVAFAIVTYDIHKGLLLHEVTEILERWDLGFTKPELNRFVDNICVEF